MGTPFMSEIRIMAFNFAPKGWALCNGQFLPINQNQALFSLLGTTYGGNGQTTFALPDLRQAALHMGAGIYPGPGRRRAVPHADDPRCRSMFISMNAANGTGAVLCRTAMFWRARPRSFTVPPHQPDDIDAGSVTNDGGSQPHKIGSRTSRSTSFALQGIFPSQN